MEPVARIDIYACGPRGYLHTRVSLPEHLVSDLPALLAAAQALNPSVDAHALVRTIWRLGCRQLRRNTERGVPLRSADVPLAQNPNAARQPNNEQMQLDDVSGLRRSQT